jgi:hypothetical protein
MIAPRFEGNGNNFPRHLTRMTIRRDKVVVDPRHTDLAPDEKIMSDSPVATEADTWVWHLDGRNVTFADASGVGGNATLGFEDPERVILDLAELVNLTRLQNEPRAALADAALDATGAGSPAQAVVVVTQGDGKGRRVANDRVHLVTRADATDHGAPADDRLLGPIDPRTGRARPTKTADVLEFDIPLGLNEIFTFLFAVPGGAAKKVSVVGIERNALIVANFTHTCADLPREDDYDLEFGRFYDLLQSHPGDRAVVPRPIDDGGEIEDCDKLSMITYEAGSGVSPV